MDWRDAGIIKPVKTQHPIQKVQEVQNVNSIPENYPLSVLSGLSGGEEDSETAPSYQSGWEKVFPASNDPDQAIYWRKGDIRIPCEPPASIANDDLSSDNDALQALLKVVIEEVFKSMRGPENLTVAQKEEQVKNRKEYKRRLALFKKGDYSPAKEPFGTTPRKSG